MFAILVAGKTLDQNWAQTVYSRSESHALDSADAMCVLNFLPIGFTMILKYQDTIILQIYHCLRYV